MGPKSIMVVTGLRREMIRWMMWSRIFRLAIREYRSIRETRTVLRKLASVRAGFAGKGKFNRIVKANGRYYWHMHLPGYPSGIFDRHFLGGINRISPVRSPHNSLATLFIGLTNSCPLRCEHCYDWQNLNKPGSLALEDLLSIARKVQEKGVTQVHFLGGEPMCRFEDLLTLTNYLKKGSDVWISTSGYRLDREKSIALKKAGLTGVAISIDHYIKEKHNSFRGHKDAWDWAMNATKNCRETGLLTCWSLCVTEDFCNLDNLLAYARLGATCKVNFIQIFEPMASGRYAGKDVRLDEKSIQILEDFFLRVNREKSFRHLPTISYTGYHQRRIGCFGGDRYIYIDADGKTHPCPFCQAEKELNFLDRDFDELLTSLKEERCKYEHCSIPTDIQGVV